MISNPITGAGYLLQGFKLLTKPGIRIYVAIPLLINMLIFGLLTSLGISYFGTLVNALLPQLPDWLQWLTWLMWLLFAFAALLIAFFSFSVMANLVGAPFNGLLAEAVEHYIGGQESKPDGGWRRVIADIGPSLRHELGKLGYFIGWSIPFLLLFIIPVVQLAAPALWMVFCAWMLAIEYGDYPMSNHGYKPFKIRQNLSGKRLMSLGFGGAVMLVTMIPIGNFLVMPAAVAGATVYWSEQLKNGAF